MVLSLVTLFTVALIRSMISKSLILSYLLSFCNYSWILVRISDFWIFEVKFLFSPLSWWCCSF